MSKLNVMPLSEFKQRYKEAYIKSRQDALEKSIDYMLQVAASMEEDSLCIGEKNLRVSEENQGWQRISAKDIKGMLSNLERKYRLAGYDAECSLNEESIAPYREFNFRINNLTRTIEEAIRKGGGCI